MTVQRPHPLRKRALVTTFWLRTWLRSVAKFKISNVTTIGRENVPKTGAAIIAANHISMLDALYLWGSLRRPSTAIAQDGLWKNKLLAAIFALLGLIPVKRGDKESGANARTLMGRVLDYGGLGIIFPEGRITRDGFLGKFYPGAADLAFEHDCIIVPVALKGIDQVLPLGKRIPKLRLPVHIRYLKPLHPGDFDSPEQMTATLRQIIAAQTNQQLAPSE